MRFTGAGVPGAARRPRAPAAAAVARLALGPATAPGVLVRGPGLPLRRPASGAIVSVSTSRRARRREGLRDESRDTGHQGAVEREDAAGGRLAGRPRVLGDGTLERVERGFRARLDGRGVAERTAPQS